MRFLVFLIVFAFSSQSFAAQCTQYRATDNTTAVTGEWSASPQAAVSSLFSKLQRVWYGPSSCQGTISYSAPTITATSFSYTGTYGGCSGGPSPTSGSGSIASRVGECEDTVCKSKQGQDFTLNWQIGYTRTPNIDDDPNWKLVAPPTKPPSDGLVCDPVTSCKVALVLIPTKTWQSLSPTSQGLYRLSVDFDAQHIGESCTPTPAENAAAHPAADKPTCPGFVGEVNGVPGCYGTASNPTANDVPETKPKPPETGNPPAGKKPDSGEGSGTGGASRTPSTGDGGPAGGPAAAAGSGTKPDGTVPKPDNGKEQAACGAPGQPKCGIDESGTPGKFDGDKAALDGWKSAVDANRNTIKDADGSFFDSYSIFFAAPPFVPCEPIELPNDVLLTRQCDVVDGTRSVMAYIWALAALWICLGWIREAI